MNIETVIKHYDQIKGIHPACDLFPEMKGEEFEKLCDDVDKNGLIDAITLTSGGLLLDGKNRLLACYKTRSQIKCETLPGSELDYWNFAISKNLERRHLTTGQRAAIASRLVPEIKKANKVGRPAKIRVKSHELNKNRENSEDRKSYSQAAKTTNVGADSVRKFDKVQEEAPELADEIKQGKRSVNSAVQEVKKRRDKPKPKTYITLDKWNTLDKEQQRKELRVSESTTQFNSQASDSIEWALWSWNPITGCKHDCPYCYARDIANRFYEQKFQPSIVPERLLAPSNTKYPASKAKKWIGHKNVFVCSMADMFGRWVPDEWIESVLDVCRNHIEWNFLFLTKFPNRMSEFEYSDNCWLGTTVDMQARVKNAEKSMAKVKAGIKWLSCEPLLEPLKFNNLDIFDWIVIGGATKSTKTDEWKPPREWVEDLEYDAKQAGLKVYEKTNLLDRVREYPGMEQEEKKVPKELLYLPQIG